MKTKKWNQLGWAFLAAYIISRFIHYYMRFLVFGGGLADLAQWDAVIDGVLLLAILLPYRKRIIAVPLLIMINGLLFSMVDLLFGGMISLFSIEKIIYSAIFAALIVYCWKKGNAQRSLEDGYLKAE